MLDSARLVSHEIAAGNLLLGSSRFLTLRLSPDWDLAPGIGRPEIVSSHERNGTKWVASGKAWYVLHNSQRRWAMELLLQVAHTRKTLPAGQEIMDVLGHEAQVRWWQRKRGLIRRRQVTFVEVAYNCPQTERFMRIELSGRCHPNAFHDLLKNIPHWRCHN